MRSRNGLINDFIEAIRSGNIKEPFTTFDLKHFVVQNNWEYSDNYLNVALGNHSSEIHSMRYRKVFISLGNGTYKIR